jgi:hypothetical protein
MSVSGLIDGQGLFLVWVGGYRQEVLAPSCLMLPAGGTWMVNFPLKKEIR